MLSWWRKEEDMAHIILTLEQVQALQSASGPLEVRDEQGRPVGRLTALTPIELDMIERARQMRTAGGHRVSTAQLLGYLDRLGQIRDAEGLDEPKMLELLGRLRAGEQV
jgi:hypothetical protein